MNVLFEVAGELVRPAVAHNLMKLIAETSEIDGQGGGNIGMSVVVTFRP